MMRKVVNALFAIMAVLLLSGVAVQAQVYDFEDYNIGDAINAIGWGGMVAEVADDPLSAGNNVLKFTPGNYNAAPVLEFTLPGGKTLADYPTFKFKAYFAQGDVGWKDIVVEAYQDAPTAQAYNNAAAKIGSWNRATGASTAWEDITIDVTGSSDLTGTIYIAFGINCAADAGGVTTIWYADDVDLGIEESPPTGYVTQWGKTSRGTAWPILNDATTPDGDAGMGDGAITTDWSSIRGGFNQTYEATTEKAIIVSGQLEYVGGGGVSAYTHMRYALTFQDSIALNYQYTDSAKWITTADSAKEKGHYGYGFMPISGAGTMSNGSGYVGTVWTVNGGGGWNSTWSNNGIAISAVKNAPRNAEMVAGIYDWAISVQPLGDGTNEVRWILFHTDKKTYWFGGTAIDTAGVSTKFNGICFSINKDNEATQFNVYEVKVDIGKPIEIPEAPWESYYVDAWGFSGGNLGGWDLTPGDFVGDVTIGGTTAPTGWSAVRGGFDTYTLSAKENRALLLTGKIELVDGGFEDVGSLRYGVFYSDSAGATVQDANLDSNWVWDGTDGAHSGYLFVPPSCANIASWSGMPGTWGAVANDTWWDIDGSNNFSLGTPLQDPPEALGTAGIYDFAISVSPHSIGNVVKTTLSKTDGSYYYEAVALIPVAATTQKFNSVAFAINNSTTTAMNLIEIQVDRGAHITTDINSEDAKQLKQLPTVYSLSQNYPNPFNPTTTIEFALPQSSEVNLVVYDISGRVVAELANGKFEAGYHKLNFDGSNLASGVYFVKLKAGDFVSVNKAMLVK